MKENKMIRVSVVALTSLALLFGACKQPASPATEAPVASGEEAPVASGARVASQRVAAQTVTLPEESDLPSQFTTIMDSLIGNYAYKGRTDLVSVIIRDGVPYIGKSAFYGCTNLVKVVIADSVSSIGENAFNGCSSLKSVEFGFRLGSIGDSAFYNCDLSSIEFPPYVAPTTIGSKAFAGNKHATKIVLTNGLVSICSNAFDYCESITSLVIPDSVKTIGSWAFNGCFSLKSVDLGHGVESIGEGAFYNACGFSSIVIPSSVKHIGAHAFWCGSNGKKGNNKVFEKVYFGTRIPVKVGHLTFMVTDPNYEGVQTADKPNWGGFKNLKEINYNGRVLPTNLFADDNRTYDKVTLGSNVREVQSGAFYGLTIKQLNISDGIETIGSNAFTWTYGLKTVVIPNSVTKISDWAFNGCFDLKDLTIGSGVKYIGNGAFYNTSIKGLTIPDNVETIGGKAFADTDNDMKAVHFGKGLKNTNIDGHLIFEGSTKNLNDVYIPANLPDVGISSYFEDCYKANGRAEGHYKWTKKKGWHMYGKWSEGPIAWDPIGEFFS